jgi:hypothetical protein
VLFRSIARPSTSKSRGIIFSKRGENAIFIEVQEEGAPRVVSAEDALALFRAQSDEEGLAVSGKFPEMFEFAKLKLLERHPLPEIRGRRKDALHLIEAVRLELKSADGYCTDLSKVIREYDDVSEGTLKDLAQLKGDSAQELFEKLQIAIPESFVRNVLGRVDRMQREGDVILLAEEFQP